MTKLITWVQERAVARDECWVWKLSSGDGGRRPQGNFEGRIINVRREVYEERAGKPIPDGWIVVPSCGHPGCVRPEHLKAITRSKRLTGRPRSLAHKMNLSMAMRAKSRLTEEIVAEIRTGAETIDQKAERYGLPRRYVWDLLHGKYWKEYVSPFAGLGART